MRNRFNNQNYIQIEMFLLSSFGMRQNDKKKCFGIALQYKSAVIDDTAISLHIISLEEYKKIFIKLLWVRQQEIPANTNYNFINLINLLK